MQGNVHSFFAVSWKTCASNILLAYFSSFGCLSVASVYPDKHLFLLFFIIQMPNTLCIKQKKASLTCFQHIRDAPAHSIKNLSMTALILPHSFFTHLPLAPHGRIRPFSSTGRPISSDTVCPPCFFSIASPSM